ncbi:MAG: hypothetical protein U9O98_04960 [Asgard group archaeon]|nr:hypothetical protein [Asgard group archaeon]
MQDENVTYLTYSDNNWEQQSTIKITMNVLIGIFADSSNEIHLVYKKDIWNICERVYTSDGRSQETQLTNNYYIPGLWWVLYDFRLTTSPSGQIALVYTYQEENGTSGLQELQQIRALFYKTSWEGPKNITQVECSSNTYIGADYDAQEKLHIVTSHPNNFSLTYLTYSNDR